MVQKLFRKGERMEADDPQLQEIVQTACAALRQHAELEEQFFYPALREAADAEDLVEEAQVEHDVAKQLIAQLDSMQGGDEHYKATFKVLGEYVNHHIEEEEGEIFRKAKRAKLDLVAIGEQIVTFKQGGEPVAADTAAASRSGGAKARGRGSEAGGSMGRRGRAADNDTASESDDDRGSASVNTRAARGSDARRSNDVEREGADPSTTAGEDDDVERGGRRTAPGQVER